MKASKLSTTGAVLAKRAGMLNLDWSGASHRRTLDSMYQGIRNILEGDLANFPYQIGKPLPA